jgi:SAM-dependent methyltransferase
VSPQGLPHEINTTKAHPARVYDYFLGGKDNYEVDREAAQKIATGNPTIPLAARANRQFMHRVTRWIARQGVRQFLDIGTGIPTEPNLHQIAQAEDRSSRIVYVDNDPIVLAHADALLRSTPEGRTTYIHGDIRNPRPILDSPELHDTIDFSRPVAVSLYALLHFLTDENNPAGILRDLLAPLPPGSYLSFSHISFDFDPARWAGAAEAYNDNVATVRFRTHDEISKLLPDLELVEPGIVPPHRWKPDGPPEDGVTDGVVSLWAGVARKPCSSRNLKAPDVSPHGLPDQIDATKPHPARMYDHFLGGKDNYEADRQAAKEVMAVHPAIGLAARVNRAFMRRTTRWLARQGVRQFLDIGTGIPTEPNLHRIAQAEDRSSRIVYVDNDPVVLAHAEALLRSAPEGRTTYIHGDVRRPHSILDAPELHDTLDLSEPVALSVLGLLHFVEDADNALGIVRSLLAALAPGSHLVISHATPDMDPETWNGIADVYKKQGIPVQIRSRDEVARFFEGLDLVDPGIVVPQAWHPDGPLEQGVTDAAVSIWAGVGRKP